MKLKPGVDNQSLLEFTIFPFVLECRFSQDTNIRFLATMVYSDFLLPVIFEPLLKTFSTTKQLCLCSANSDHGYYNVYAH